MSIGLFLKQNLKNFPPRLGKLINSVPYEMRPGLGKVYRQRLREIDELETLSPTQKQQFVLERMQRLVSFAYKNIKFYKDIYDKNGFSPSQLMHFEDIQDIPIITKSMLNRYDIEDRSFNASNRYIVNTGGSSGTPFSFYIEPSSMGHEWAHMHTIWKTLGYHVTDFKLLFGGRSDIKHTVDYDVVRNHFAIDIYEDYEVLSSKLIPLVNKYDIRYLHGYPSSIYDFALYCENHNHKLRNLLRKTLRGVFLGSEYPQKLYRDIIEKVFEIATISWYGHTERAVLAYEANEQFKYCPFLSYGFTEAIRNMDGNYDLISTSYYNRASPLIRYNTQDTIEEPLSDDGILKSFKILQGREGEYVVDKKGKKINLTALIFGRHHELFNFIDYMQIRQIEQGCIEVLFVGKELVRPANQLFDSSNLDFEINFKQIDEPIRTPSGKLSLLVK
ncbi:MAG TPA: hypothetical protein VKZ57_11860 [Sphingobacterium sp.]|nr:hypothetical protein [Sphingobacterium sp.]